MTYKEMNQICKDNNVYGTQFYIAEEMECQFYDADQANPSDERFEQLCGRAYYLYLKSENLSITSICRAVGELEANFETFGIQDPLTMDKWAILDLAAMKE